MPQGIEIPVVVTKVTTTPFKSDIVADNDAQRAVNFPATPARVASQSVDLPHKLVYVEQSPAHVGGTVENISVVLQ